MCFFNQTVFKTIIRLLICLVWLFDPVPADCLQTREVGVVNVDRLNMRTEPGAGCPVLKVLGKDDQVRILKHLKGWFQVIHDGDVGYVSDSPQYLKLYTIHTVSRGERTDLDVAKTKIREIEQKIRAHESEIVSYTRQEKKIIRMLLETDSALSEARRQAKDLQAELAVTNAEISRIQASAEQMRNAMDKRKTYAVNRMVSLYKLNMLGGMNLFASATSLNDLLRRKAALERILAYDYEVIEEMVGQTQRLTALLEQLNAKKAEKVALDEKYQAAVARLSAEKAKREKILADIKTKKSNRLATIKYLKRAAAELDHTLATLGKGPDTAHKTTDAFFEFKGLLKMPVRGNITSAYGAYTDSYSKTTDFRNGIEIQAERGTPIRSVFGGNTIYADWLKGYGNVIILAHGDQYHTVYAHAEDLFKAKGETVETGEVIATVGDSGAMGGPSLYFEIRHQGSPVNPADWLDDSM